MVNCWYTDHVYNRRPNAMSGFSLIAVICLSFFLASYQRNLKPAARRATDMRQVARLITTEPLDAGVARSHMTREQARAHAWGPPARPRDRVLAWSLLKSSAALDHSRPGGPNS